MENAPGVGALKMHNNLEQSPDPDLSIIFNTRFYLLPNINEMATITIILHFTCCCYN